MSSLVKQEGKVKMKMKKTAVFGVPLILLQSAFADLYVDAAADATSADGTAQHPYATIQAAVNAAANGETIHIAAGVYASGGYELADSTASRVYIDGKSLHLIGAGRGKTVIVGKSGSGADGRGSGAWRCIHINYGQGSVIEGVTLKGGATVNPDYSLYVSRSGGGLVVDNGGSVANRNVYLVDSEILDCRAVYGGGTKGGTLVRCMLDGCYADAGLASYDSCLVNCVVTRSLRAGYISDDGVATMSSLLNCTLADNSARYALVNCDSVSGTVVVLSSSVSENKGSALGNCVLSSTASRGRMQLLGPAVGDFRLVAGSDAVGAADVSSLEGLSLPEGIDPMCDLTGRKIVAKDGKIDVGAFQGAVTPAAGGLYFQPDTHSVPLIADGRTNLLDGATWVFPEIYPTQYVFGAKSDGLALCRLARRDASGNASAQLGFAPGLDNSFRLVPPPESGVVATNYFEFAGEGKIRWTDPVNGNDDWGEGVVDAGTETHPYRTLRKALLSMDCTTGASVIYAKKGLYDRGTMTNNWGVFRVALEAGSYGRVRIVAVDGPEETFIVGAADPESTETGTYAGCGANAVRGVYLTGKSDVCIQGFTITGCYSSNQTQYQSRCRGAAFYSDEGSLRAQITDCIISNNYGFTSIVHGGLMKRCRIEGNFSNGKIFNGGSDTETLHALNGTAAFCVFANNTLTSNEEEAGIAAGAARVYNCTVVGVPHVGYLVGGRSAYSLNTIYYGKGIIHPNASLMNCVLWGFRDVDESSEGIKKLEDPDFISRSKGDYRVSRKSPCIGYAAALDADPCFWGVFDGAMDGALAFTNGRAVVGAYQETLEKKEYGFTVIIK